MYFLEPQIQKYLPLLPLAPVREISFPRPHSVNVPIYPTLQNTCPCKFKQEFKKIILDKHTILDPLLALLIINT